MNNNLSKIIDLINSKNYLKAEAGLIPLLQKNPTSFDLNKAMAMTLMAQKKYNKSLIFYQKCMQKNDKDFDVLLNISFLFLKVQQCDMTIKFATDALKVKPETPGPHQNIANAYYLLQDFELARKHIDKCIQIRGGIESKFFYLVKDLRILYGEILLAQGEKKIFSDYCKKLLKNVFDTDLLTRLLRNNPKDIEAVYIDKVYELIKIIPNNKNIIQRNSHLSSSYFFLAEYYSPTDKKKSEEFYIKANMLISEMQRESLFNRQKFYFNIIKFFKKNSLNEIANKIDPNKGKGLIFIVGMPRSGTTLTESILSTANDIAAGGEKNFFPVQLNETISNLNSETILSEKFFIELGDRYLHFVKSHRKNKTNFIDKLPENFLYYKFIKLALPKAKFVHCVRDIWDTSTSLFKQNYSVNVFFASSFFGIATEFANYLYLIDFWKKLDGENCFYEIKYEEMTSDPHKIVNGLWSFLELSGEYDEKKRQSHFGRTASMQQVTKTIYQSSIKKDDFSEKKDDFFKDIENQKKHINSKFLN